MTTPYKLIEEYVFMVPGVSGSVYGRILQMVLTSEEKQSKDKHGLTYKEFEWDTSYHDESQSSPGSHHCFAVEEARSQLLRYVKAFKPEKAKKNENY
ncbi:hypothetical protein [Serratia sp. 2C06]|uniref:hypothetical protein n=1 Tax=Serratia sp. 2C06 TaxID=3416180 RepID=UPI003CEC9C49